MPNRVEQVPLFVLRFGEEGIAHTRVPGVREIPPTSNCVGGPVDDLNVVVSLRPGIATFARARALKKSSFIAVKPPTPPATWCRYDLVVAGLCNNPLIACMAHMASPSCLSQ